MLLLLSSLLLLFLANRLMSFAAYLQGGQKNEVKELKGLELNIGCEGRKGNCGRFYSLLSIAGDKDYPMLCPLCNHLTPISRDSGNKYITYQGHPK